MYEWVLIAYLWSHPHGGPVSIEFISKEACQSAIVEMKKEMSDVYVRQKALCLNKKTGTQEGPKQQ